MTDQELDRMMRRVLLDSLRADETAEEARGPFEPSRKHRHQMKEMLRDPLKWVRNKTKPLWKITVQKIALILLVVSVGLGSLMAVSPTVRAAVIQWVTEWYETHIVYRFSGEANSTKMPNYEITDIPENFIETDRVENTSSVGIFYEDNDGGVISFDYVYMQQSTATIVTIQNNVVNITVNGFEGQLFLPTETKSTTTVVWMDTHANIQFAIDTTLNEAAIMQMAESVSLVNSKKNNL